MLTKEFYEMFEVEYAKGGNLCDAYERTEKLFEAKYNHRKYSNFQSFNVSRYHRIKRSMMNPKKAS